MHLEQSEPIAEDPVDIDFFKEHETLETSQWNTKVESSFPTPQNNISTDTTSHLLGPSIQPSETLNVERKPTIGGRKAQPKKSGVSICNC